ncbi:MAG: 2-hydroxychromene-2-carboxylate isomerase [Lysobacteraceae bacterium]|nr:MAG: 2-hydroxychromene-2-carboxylate isomerase [Xanthomonadaceae bacterium]
MSAAPIRWYFDFISPFAYMQWPRVRAVMAEFPIVPTPILLAAVLDRCGQKGPAEIPAKREFTYRHVLWQARQAGIALRFPPAHPFNPLAALRLCVAAGATPDAIERVFDWVWAQGRPADSAEALAVLRETMGVPEHALGDAAVKTALRENTEQALAAGVFGVPTLALGKHLFWGNDAHEFAMAALRDPGLLEAPEMRQAAELPVGVQRG